MLRLIGSLFLTCCFVSVAAQSIKPFTPGDRVAFLGNSITEAGHYHSFVWLFYMTRFPKDRIDIFNLGIGGNNVADMERRFYSDVISKEPNYLLLTFGMNDSGYEGYEGAGPELFARKQYEKTKTAFIKIEKNIKASTSLKEVALLGSTPYDEKAFNSGVKSLTGKNKTMQEMVGLQRDAARQNKWGFLDFNLPVSQINKREQLRDSTFSLSGGDRIHPDKDGHMVMAYLFLKAQGFAGNKVAEVIIDRKLKKLQKAENCEISNLQVSANNIHFDYLSKSLPYPIDTIPRWGTVKTAKDALGLVPFTKEMNQERLCVKNLKGNYELKIDGQRIGVFSALALDTGVNLAEYSWTPQYQQALQVLYLNEERYEIERRLRQYASMEYVYLEGKGLLFADNRKAIEQINEDLPGHYLLKYIYPNYTRAMFSNIRETWQQMMELLIRRIYEINKPVNHRVEINKI